MPIIWMSAIFLALYMLSILVGKEQTMAVYTAIVFALWAIYERLGEKE